MSEIFTTNRDAIEQVIIPAIEGTGVASASEYDVQAIFEAAFTWTGRGFEQSVDEAGFWAIVEAAEVVR